MALFCRYLGGNSVRAGREELRHTGYIVSGLSQAKSSPETSSTCSHNNSIERVINNSIAWLARIKSARI